MHSLKIHLTPNTRALAITVFGLLLTTTFAPVAHAQGPLWTLALDQPNKVVTGGTSGNVTYTGSITNLSSATDLNIFSDTLTSGIWNSTLSFQEAPSFIDFLNNTGFVGPNQSYTGALFTVSYTAATPSSITPYDGQFFVFTEGTPQNLSTPFTLLVQSGTTPPTTAAPEPSSIALLLPLLTLGIAANRFKRERSPRRF
jgi:hypothetical protein